MSNVLRDACLLVASCDAYSDLWPIVDRQLERQWPECGLRKVLLVNTARPAFHDLEPLAVGPDAGWSANLRRALERIPERFVFLYVDDLFLTRRVDNGEVERLLCWAMRSGAKYLRFHPRPKLAHHGADVVEIPHATPYRTATVMSFWDRSVLHSLLSESENAWDFELRGSRRGARLDGFYATTRSHFGFYNLVVKGALRRRAVRLLGEHGHSVPPTRRRMSIGRDMAQVAKDLGTRAFWALPPAFAHHVHDALGRDDRYASHGDPEGSR